MSAVNNQAAQAAVPDAKAAAVPRKRRRRAPTTGATEDCFTCRKRGTKCDRRRPYCTQCIDMGKECSGYRTTLTWGVGVASRGKLRGMTLPIAKSAQTSAARETKSKSPSTPTTKSSPRKPATPYGMETPRCKLESSQSPMSSPAPSLHDFNDYGLSASAPIPIPPPVSTPPAAGWHVPGFADHVDGYHAMTGKPRSYLPPRPLQRLQTTMASSFDDNLSTSTGPLSTYSDSDYPSPGEYPTTPEDYTFSVEPPMGPQFPGPYLHGSDAVNSSESLPFAEPPRSYPVHQDLSSSMNSERSVHHFMDNVSMPPGSVPVTTSINDMYFGPELATSGPQDFQYGLSFGDRRSAEPQSVHSMPHDMGPLSAPIPRSTYSTLTISPRTQFLLDYYVKAICPALVAFDSSSNPYRMHIMRLAEGSECLQNAIAALSTNNMRMRGGPENGRSRETLDHAYANLDTLGLRQLQGEPTAEEQHYRAKSIEQLNALLADPERARDDSVLATLLVLCLFHVCDSGISKFKTQFAGVQKLLQMRQHDVKSEFISFVELFFSWFDIMTATVNDRETQIPSSLFDALDLSALAVGQHGLEQVVGCEGGLFKLIARLSRLNLLAQHRTVRNKQDQQPQTPRPTPSVLGYENKSPETPKDFNNLHRDPVHGSHAWEISSQNPADAVGNSPEVLPPSQQFWTEWHSLRQQLHDWRLEVPPTPGHPNQSTSILSQTQQDLLHSSESFRCAALLYVERLAAPCSPSSAPAFQSLVGRAVFHLSQINIGSSVKRFLLWPLFIIGAESTNALHRQIIRERCLQIQRMTGFANNLSSLEVLEKVWHDEDTSQANQSRSWSRRSDRWRRAMDRTDGEYIII
jgi:hypothetical protein